MAAHAVAVGTVPLVEAWLVVAKRVLRLLLLLLFAFDDRPRRRPRQRLEVLPDLLAGQTEFFMEQHLNHEARIRKTILTQVVNPVALELFELGDVDLIVLRAETLGPIGALDLLFARVIVALDRSL